VAIGGWPKNLTWQNFRVVQSAPAGVTEEAQTEASIEPPPKVQVLKDGNQFRLAAFDVKVRIVPHGTWVVRGKSSAPLLVHEQGHWDIAGLTAHEYHAALEGLRAASPAELGTLAEQALQRIKTKVDRLQEKYDRETNHSRDAGKQTQWNTLIRTCITNGNRALPDP
jgi:hypothetical protein